MSWEMSEIRPKVRRTPNISVKSLFLLKCHANKKHIFAILYEFTHTHKFIRLKILGTAPEKLDLSIEISLMDLFLPRFQGKK